MPMALKNCLTLSICTDSPLVLRSSERGHPNATKGFDRPLSMVKASPLLLALTGFVIGCANFRAIRHTANQSQTYSRNQPKGLEFDLDSAWGHRQVRV